MIGLHDTKLHLLDQDFTLSRDEYWMVKKDKTSQSRLSPLTDFNAQKRYKLQKDITGTLRALPIIATFHRSATGSGLCALTKQNP